MEPPTKTKHLSVICSNKAMCASHRARIHFVNGLQPLLPMHRFGQGVKPLADTWDGLAPYRSTTVIENCRAPHYWTEKIADWCGVG